MKTFHHFHDAKKIDDWTINNWIHKSIAEVRGGKPAWSISSGDTEVICIQYDSEIQVAVCNSDGRSILRFSTCPGFEDPIEFEPYARPVLEPA